MSALHPTAVLLLRRLRIFWSRILAALLVEKQKSQFQSFTTESVLIKLSRLLCTAQHWAEVFAKLSSVWCYAKAARVCSVVPTSLKLTPMFSGSSRMERGPGRLCDLCMVGTVDTYVPP